MPSPDQETPDRVYQPAHEGAYPGDERPRLIPKPARCQCRPTQESEVIVTAGM